VNVTNKPDNKCIFPFEVEIRKSALCSETPCNTTEAGAKAAAIVSVQVNETVTTSAADTGPQGLLAKISNEDVNTNGLTAAASVSTQDVGTETEFGVTIRIEIQTDDYPTETSWTLIDICPDGAVVATGGGYTKTGQTDMRTIYNRNSRYLFNIIDTGGDGICCNTGSQGSYKIFVDSSFQAGGAEFGSGDTELFGKEVCNGVTFKPTNVLTASPTNNPTIMPTGQPPNKPTSLPTNTPTLQPTSLPTASMNVQIKIDITFDDYPEDTSWFLYNTCNGGEEVIRQDDQYGDPIYRKSTLNVYDETVHDGTFKFVIKDEYGDGICCQYGTGGYTVNYGSMTFAKDSSWDISSEDTYDFGTSAKCPALKKDKASYDSSLGVPKCETVGTLCTTVGTGPTGELGSELLSAKANLKEPNGPNTLDTCTDGNAGIYKEEAETVESISVESVDGGLLRAGGNVTITASVYTYGNGETDRVDFYHSNSPGPNPDWTPIKVNVKPSSNSPTVEVTSGQFTLLDEKLQAVRVSIRWTGETSEATPCPTSGGGDSGQFSDVDDLTFVVDTTSSDGTMSFALSQPNPVVLPELLLEELQMNCADVLESDRCKAAIDCEWRSDSILGSFMSLGMASCHLAQ